MREAKSFEPIRIFYPLSDALHQAIAAYSSRLQKVDYSSHIFGQWMVEDVAKEYWPAWHVVRLPFTASNGALLRRTLHNSLGLHINRPQCLPCSPLEQHPTRQTPACSNGNRIADAISVCVCVCVTSRLCRWIVAMNCGHCLELHKPGLGASHEP